MEGCLKQGNGMGRRKLIPLEKTERVVIRMNKDLKEHLIETAAGEGMNLSQWMTWIAARTSKYAKRRGTSGGIAFGTLIFAGDASAQVWSGGTVDPHRLLWAAAVAVFIGLTYEAVVTKCAAAFAYGTMLVVGLLAQFGAIDLESQYGILFVILTLVVAVAFDSRHAWRELRKERAAVRPVAPEPAYHWLVPVATGLCGLVAIFVGLDWLAVL